MLGLEQEGRKSRRLRREYSPFLFSLAQVRRRETNEDICSVC